METLIYLILAFTFSRMTAAYEEHLLIPGYVELSHSMLSKALISAHAPTRKEPNTGNTRYLITAAGLFSYFVFALCLFFCVKSGLAPSGGGEIFASSVHKGGIVGVRLETAAQKHSSLIALSGLLASIAIWLLNTLGTRLSNAESPGGRVMLIIIHAAGIILLLKFCFDTIAKL